MSLKYSLWADSRESIFTVGTSLLSSIAMRWTKLLLMFENSVKNGIEDRSIPSIAAVVELLK